jgi:hypothetical protein
MLTPAARLRSQGNRTIVRALIAALIALAATGVRAAQAQAKEDTVPRLHVLPALGLRVGTPQKASAAFGVVVGQDWQQNGRDHSRNVALFAEPGISGGRASVAYVYHGYGGFGSGLGVAASVLRTWKDPWTVRQNQSYVGGEVILWPIVFVGPRVGLFRNISGTETSRRWFVSFDFGIGL